MTVRYPSLLKIRPIIGVFTVPVVVILAIGAALAIARHSPSLPDMTFCLPLLLVPILALVQNTRATWFFVYEYGIDGSILVARDPILRKSKTIDLTQVTVVRDFSFSAQRVPAAWRPGHVLVSRDGTKIPLTEALPLWPQIETYLVGIPREPQPIVWRWVG